MRAHTHRVPLALLLAFAVLLPAFWMIGLAQANAAHAGATPVEATEQIEAPRVPSSRPDATPQSAPSIAPPSDRPELIESKDVVLILTQPAAASTLHLSLVRAPGADEPTPDGAASHVLPLSHAGASLPAVDVPLPTLSRGETQRLARLLMPPAPALEVPTTPPLLCV